MTQKKHLLIIIGFFIATVSVAQNPVQERSIDTTITNYDALFNQLDALLDSMIAPRSFTLINLGISNNYFSYSSKTSFLLESLKKLTYVPSISYFHKSGLGVSATAALVNDGEKINSFQYYITGSYDYLRNNKFLTGAAYSRFFTKDSLPFYTSPLLNEVYAYFIYRNFWLKPGISASYGWGNRVDYFKREDYITSLQLASDGYTIVNTKETISDLNLSFSIRHDFYCMNILSKNDYIRITPQVVYIAGTQQFGFNQTNNSTTTIPKTDINAMANSDKVYLDNNMNFQPLSLSGFIKLEYSWKKIFIQPQVMVGYYFPAKEKNFNTAFLVNAGLLL